MTVPGMLNGQKVLKAREMVLEKLKEQNLVIKEEIIKQNVSTAERTSGIVEPLPKLQWFINVNKEFTIPHSEIPGIPSGSATTLKQMMKAAVENDGIDILPERFERVYYNWIDNLRDWCISRQIWFGHRIPVWHLKHGSENWNIENRDKALELFKNMKARKLQNVRVDLPKNGRKSVLPPGHIMKNKDGSEKTLTEELPIESVDFLIVIGPGNEELIKEVESIGFTQDEDTLDTWFSSGLWTFSTLGWPNQTKDLETYHPTSVLETGYDIIFFWVARMILMSGFLVGQVPFKNVYLHGLVRDGQGRKMSKSLGNIIDPLVMIEKFGADATRLSLIIGAQMGNDLRLSEDKVRGYKNFANKIWNISRFVLENSNGTPAEFNDADKKLIEEAQATADEITKHIENFRLDLAADTTYHYVWDRFAAEILEESKPIMRGEDMVSKQGPEAASRRYALFTILTMYLKILHPFMPFVTEAIWQKLPATDADLLWSPSGPQHPQVRLVQTKTASTSRTCG